MNKYMNAVIGTACLTMVACGNSGGSKKNETNIQSDKPQSDILTGQFWNVQNLRYQTSSQHGYTTANGAFAYKAGENITFYIGDLALPSIPAKALITPRDFGEDTGREVTLNGTTEYVRDITSQAATNITRLLITLDSSGNLYDGIQIADAAHSGITVDLNWDVTPDKFAENVESEMNLLYSETPKKSAAPKLLPPNWGYVALAEFLNNRQLSTTYIAGWRLDGYKVTRKTDQRTLGDAQYLYEAGRLKELRVYSVDSVDGRQLLSETKYAYQNNWQLQNANTTFFKVVSGSSNVERREQTDYVWADNKMAQRTTYDITNDQRQIEKEVFTYNTIYHTANKLVHTAENGSIASFSYGPIGDWKISKLSSDTAEFTQFEYDPAGRLIAHQDYDAAQIAIASSLREYSYPSNGERVQEDSTNKRTFTFLHSGCGLDQLYIQLADTQDTSLCMPHFMFE